MQGLRDRLVWQGDFGVTEEPGSNELMERIVEHGDRQAFALLFARHAPQVKRYYLRHGIKDSTAEEYAQEVLLRVWRRAPSFDPKRAAFTTWLFTIARNLKIDQFRKKRVLEVDLDDPAIVVGTEPQCVERIEARQRTEQIRDAMIALPEPQAEVLEMVYFQGMTMAAIAEAQSLSVGTIKSRVRLAVARLRMAFGAVGET